MGCTSKSKMCDSVVWNKENHYYTWLLQIMQEHCVTCLQIVSPAELCQCLSAPQNKNANCVHFSVLHRLLQDGLYFKSGMVFLYTCKFDFVYSHKNSITCPGPMFMMFTNSEQHIIRYFTQICHWVWKVQNMCPSVRNGIYNTNSHNTHSCFTSLWVSYVKYHPKCSWNVESTSRY